MSTGKHYTDMVVSQAAAQPKRYRVEKSLFGLLVLGSCALFVCAVFAAVHYRAVLGEADENVVLRTQNNVLRGEISRLEARLLQTDERLKEIERFDRQLRSVMQLSDPDRNLAMGPLQRPLDVTHLSTGGAVGGHISQSGARGRQRVSAV